MANPLDLVRALEMLYPEDMVSIGYDIYSHVDIDGRRTTDKVWNLTVGYDMHFEFKNYTDLVEMITKQMEEAQGEKFQLIIECIKRCEYDLHPRLDRRHYN